MNKQEFLTQLESALSGLPQDDIEERLTFYSEMIDDRIEDGLLEDEAVAEIGPIDKVAEQIIADYPLPKLVKERIKPKQRMQAWEIVLLVLGFPIWFPLLIAAAAILFSVYVVIWALIVSLWAVFVSFIVGALGGVAAGAGQFIKGYRREGLMLIGAAGVLLAGLSIFLFFGCKAATKGAFVLTKKIALGIKSLFLRKEN